MLDFQQDYSSEVGLMHAFCLTEGYTWIEIQVIPAEISIRVYPGAYLGTGGGGATDTYTHKLLSTR